MRVAQVTSSLTEPLGGAEQYCIELSVWLAAAGNEVTLFGTGAGPRLIGDLAARGVEVAPVPASRPYPPGQSSSRRVYKAVFHAMDLIESFGSSRASRAVRRGAFDVVHVHRWPGFGASVLRQDRVGAPTIHTVHDFALVDTTTTTTRSGRPVDGLPLAQRLRAKALVPATGRIGLTIFPTARTQARHQELGAVLPAARSMVVPHGWRLPSVDRPRRKPSDTPFTFLYMGKLVEEKGVDELLRAWGRGVGDARLRIAGAGHLEQVVRNRSGASGIEYLGWLDKSQQAAALAEADALVLPSLWPENFPLVVAESLVAGVPVLANTASAPAILKHGHNAEIVEPGVERLREAMVRLAGRPDYLLRLIDGAVATAEDLDFDRHGERVLSAYRRAMTPAA